MKSDEGERVGEQVLAGMGSRPDHRQALLVDHVVVEAHKAPLLLLPPHPMLHLLNEFV